MLSAELLAQIALIMYAEIPKSHVHMRDDIITELFIVTETSKKKAGEARQPFWQKFRNLNPYYSALSVYFKMPFWLIIDINGPYLQ